MKNDIVKMGIILVVGIIVGSLLLMVSYLLPAGIIEKNINKSIGIFVKEDKYESDMYNYKNTKLDNFTDAIMLQNASYTGRGSIISKAMNVYRFQNDDEPSNSLILQMQGKKDSISSYDRYWHGYLIILKPLLIIFSYSDVRVINSIVQPLIVLAVAILMMKRNKEKYILPYFISVLVISPMTIAKSLQYSTVFYLFNISMIVMLLYNDKLKEKNRYTLFFLVVGMLTSYFDFLTYPLVTLGMPLMLYFILNPHNEIFAFIKSIINKSITWGVGYVGMWIGKVVIGSILLGRNLFSSAASKFAERTSLEVQTGNVTILSVFERNLLRLVNKPYLLLALCIVLYVIYRMIKTNYKFSKKGFISFIPYFIISIMPFAWYVVASNHSYIHSWFTYRVMMITVFSLLSYVATMFSCVGGKNEKSKRKENSRFDTVL